jgi:PAS domain S-box-containing protein
VTWWLGDVGGALIVAPALVLWSNDRSLPWRGLRLLELVLLLGAVVLCCRFVFHGVAPFRGPFYPLKFISAPLLLWAAFRFGPRETATASLLLASLATSAALVDWGNLRSSWSNQALLTLQGFLALTSVTMLAIAASVRTRRETAGHLRHLNEDLERVVAARTAELEASNQDLTREMAARAGVQARLLEAQRMAHIGSWEWDVASNTVWWSDELYRIYGLEPQSVALSYDGVLARVHPDDRARVDGTVRQARDDRQPFQFEHRIVRPDGSERTLLAQGHVRLVDGTLTAMLGTGHDITERKRAEAEGRGRREAEEANRLKEEFLAVLSHELRTPLNAILVWARLLQEGRLDEPTAARAVETIVRNARLQDRLIADILDVSRIVSGRISLQLVNVDLRALVETQVENQKPQARARDLEVAVSAPTGLPRLRGDSARLSQVVNNILSNALRFAKSRIEIALALSGNQLILEVRDDGPGIPADFLPHLFDRFRQADASTTRRHGGLGLGLAIVRQLVELHGGNVAAGNRPEGGAVVTVRLPLTRAPSERGPGPEPARPLPAVQLEGLRVLVVDDERDGREVACTLLRQWGAEASSASSAREALSAIAQEVPDVVLADIGMPEEDGYALLRRVRALPPQDGGQVPVAALTAYAGAEHRERLLGAGFLAHLTKPLQPEALANVLLELVRVRNGQGG